MSRSRGGVSVSRSRGGASVSRSRVGVSVSRHVVAHRCLGHVVVHRCLGQEVVNLGLGHVLAHLWLGRVVAHLFLADVRGQSVEQQQNHARRRTILPFGRLAQLDLGGTVTNILPPGVICNQWLHEADIEWLHAMATVVGR